MSTVRRLKLKKRKYKVKITPKLIKILKKYWDEYRAVEDAYNIEICHIEEKMEKETGIKGIEFFRSDGGSICGIGDFGLWTMPLVQAERLEK